MPSFFFKKQLNDLQNLVCSVKIARMIIDHTSNSHLIPPFRGSDPISPLIHICLEKIQGGYNTNLTTCKRFGQQIHAVALKTAYFFHATALKSLELFKRACTWSTTQIRHLALFVYDTSLVIVNAAKAAVQKTVTFIHQNWKQLLAYLLAWTVIVVGTGLLYGFEAVALPLTIGLAFGFGLGIMSGILMVETLKVYDPENTLNGQNTLWNLLNRGLESLDPNGTRLIMLSVAVTVILATAVVFPYATGGLLGVFIGNQIATKIGQDRDLGIDLYDTHQKSEVFANQIEAFKKEHFEQALKIAELEKMLSTFASPEHHESTNPNS
ncbi:MAG: hypothetical protein S4CHLAM123_05200 [Chlamydiales bacterium]|nr:hypothetical protein [Chlamydiales bacterium]